MTVTSDRGTLLIERVFTTAGVHPYDQVAWVSRDVVMKNWRDGTVNFEQYGVEFPDFWSENAANIVTTKYFRGAVGTPQRETGLRQVIDRIVGKYVAAFLEHGYGTPEQALILEHELTYMLLHQVFSFNSPVWFNVGTAAPQQVSACFILAVDDSMDSILNWYKEEGKIFQGGSGAGVSLSHIRSSKELLKSGGTASGPVSFMRGADASAGTIKSGGATRRAAKMVVLDVDHPDIEEFIETKVREEDKIRALRDAGFDMDLGGKDIVSVQYQNANNSVRVTDAFMRAVEAGADYDLIGRRDGKVLERADARRIWRQIAEAAWACADPGVQYDGAIQDWHTTPNSGRISASNPCSEYMSLDNSSCNLASMNLLKFLMSDGTFDAETFAAAVKLVFTAMDVSICFADFPTEKIGETTRAFRQLGIGYANLGALLMATGHAYDSEGGRALAAAITSLMSGAAYERSAELAAAVSPYDGYLANDEAHLRVLHKHRDACANLPVGTPEVGRIAGAALGAWNRAEVLADRTGLRNAQVSLLPPTGTIGLAMDCDTTGIEPGFSLVQYKKLVGGGDMRIANQSVARGLAALGYTVEEATPILAFVAEHGHVVGAPGLAAEHYEVFDCAVGQRAISPMGHLRMMAAVQPFLSGAISKSVNMPAESTVDDIAGTYFEGWKLGLKAVAIYRDGSKVGQPLSDKKKDAEPEVKVVEVNKPTRKRLPKKRRSQTVSFAVAGAEGYMTAGEYEDGTLGEVFIKMSKQGSTLAGVMDAFSVSISIGLQYGVPLEAFVSKYINMRFDPAGMTDDADIRIAQSIVDYLFRRLAIDYLDADARAELGIATVAERTAAVAEYDAPVAATEVVVEAPRAVVHDDAPLCMTCGVKMRRAGSCHLCESCGSTSGCS